MKLRLIIAGIVAFFLAYSTKSIAQTSPLEKTWYDGKKTSKIQIYKGADGKFYGKMVWLNQATDPKTGKPYTDSQNPDESLRNKPLIGNVLLQGFVQSSNNKNEFTGGTVYDPNNGKTYCGTITLKGNKLDLRGYLCSFSLFGRTEEWTPAESEQASGN